MPPMGYCNRTPFYYRNFNEVWMKICDRLAWSEIWSSVPINLSSSFYLPASRNINYTKFTAVNTDAEQDKLMLVVTRRRVFSQSTQHRIKDQQSKKHRWSKNEMTSVKAGQIFDNQGRMEKGGIWKIIPPTPPPPPPLLKKKKEKARPGLHGHTNPVFRLRWWRRCCRS